jgi:hypothetical protein
LFLLYLNHRFEEVILANFEINHEGFSGISQIVIQGQGISENLGNV